MPDYTPVNNVNFAVYTSTASAAITGGQLVSVSGVSTVGPSAGGDHPVGLALHDAPSGGRVAVAMIPNVVHEAVVSAAVVAGAGVVSAAAGQATSATIGVAGAAGTLLGIWLNSQPTIGQKARFLGM